jgi:hypothetical protein
MRDVLARKIFFFNLQAYFFSLSFSLSLYLSIYLSQFFPQFVLLLGASGRVIPACAGGCVVLSLMVFLSFTVLFFNFWLIRVDVELTELSKTLKLRFNFVEIIFPKFFDVFLQKLDGLRCGLHTRVGAMIVFVPKTTNTIPPESVYLFYIFFIY